VRAARAAIESLGGLRIELAQIRAQVVSDQATILSNFGVVRVVYPQSCSIALFN
jgi:hypothetical protein